MQRHLEEDVRRQATSVGPHRDDLVFSVGPADLRKYGSQGQQRTAVLALKLSELEYVKSETGEYPVLLLDDVMSELDPDRRQALLDFVRDRIQTFITTTEPGIFAGMAGWHRWERLFELAHVAVAHRPGYAFDAKYLPSALADVFQRRFCDNPRLLPETPAGHIVTFAMTPLDISATKIRTLLSKGLSARYLMPESVIAHIHDHRFYTEN